MTRVFPALVALMLCLVLTPIQSQIWNGAEMPTWIRHLGSLHTAARLFHGQTAEVLGHEPYEAFGRLMALVYLGALWTAWQTILRRTDAPVLSHLFVGALSIAAMADGVSYWIAGLSDPAHRHISFWWMGLPALLACLILLTAMLITTIEPMQQKVAGASPASQKVEMS